MQKSQENAVKKIGVNWNLNDLLKSTLVISILLILFVVISRQIDLKSFLETQQYRSITIFILILLQNLIFLVPIYLLVLKPKQVSLKTLGFKKVKLEKLIGYVTLGFILFFTITTTISILQLIFNFELPGFGQQIQKLPIFGEGTINMIIAGFTIIILAPVAEEIIFRGFLYQVLAKYITPLMAIPLGGFIFAIAHLELNVILPLWLLGTLMCFLFAKTKSIYTTIIFHMVNNSLAFIIEYFIISH